MPSEQSWTSDPWQAGAPLTDTTVAGRYCAALAGCPIDWLDVSALRTHPGLTLSARPDVLWPAVLARVFSSDRKPCATLARMLSPDEPHGQVPLLKPVRWWGERGGGTALMVPALRRNRHWR